MTFDSKDELHKIRRLLDTRAKAEVSRVVLAVPASFVRKGHEGVGCQPLPVPAMLVDVNVGSNGPTNL